MNTDKFKQAQDDTSKPSLGEQRTDLAYERSSEAAERTLMAAVRTAVSMISFGFAIGKLFGFMLKIPALHGEEAKLENAPSQLGFVLLVGGILTLVMGLVEYKQATRELRLRPDAKLRISTALFSAVFVLVTGLILTISMLTATP